MVKGEKEQNKPDYCDCEARYGGETLTLPYVKGMELRDEDGRWISQSHKGHLKCLFYPTKLSEFIAILPKRCQDEALWCQA